MQLLEERILKFGKVYPGNVLKVDSFLNHQIDVTLLSALAKELFNKFSHSGVNKIMTVEASGIALATLTAELFAVPMVFAKKKKTTNLDSNIYTAAVHSYTHQKDYEIMVSKEYITASDRVLLIDDFLANGCALKGLKQIADEAGAIVVGAGIAIEKGFQGGGDELRASGLQVESLAIIQRMTDDGKIEFRR